MRVTVEPNGRVAIEDADPAKIRDMVALLGVRELPPAEPPRCGRCGCSINEPVPVRECDAQGNLVGVYHQACYRGDIIPPEHQEAARKAFDGEIPLVFGPPIHFGCAKPQADAPAVIPKQEPA